ncbi:glycosyltransferase family 39 protein [bacterium]|nr:glycosyltransferase family 39 protein [bacterium]
MVNTSFIVAVKAKLQWFLFAGLIALAVRLWFCFIDGHIPSVYSCDASEYLRDAQYLETVSHFSFDFWIDALKVLVGVASPDTIAQTREKMAILMPLVKQSGFVFPFFIYLSHVLFGAPIDYGSWWAPIFIQTIMSALTCTLIGLCANYAFSYRAGLWAAFLSAIYPGFIVNTVRLYSEIFACFFMCLSFYCLTRISKQGSWKNFLLLGFSLAVMQVARSPLVMIAILSLLYVLWIKRRDLKPGPILWKQLGGLFLGAALVFSLSLSVQKLTTGKASLVTDRVGSYNLSTGLNLNDKGWLAYPYPDLTGIESMKFFQIISDRLKNPKQFFQLMMDKPPRLLKFHWNDFRVKIGPIDNQIQVIVHQGLMLLACLGICLGLFVKPNFEERALDFRLFLLVCALSHVTFALFITVPRYALTAIPELLVFAGFAAAFLSERIFQMGRRRSALAMTIALVLVLIVSQLNLNLTLGSLAQALMKAALGAGLFIWLCTWLKKQTFVETKMACLTTFLMGALFTFCWAWPAYAHGRTFEFAESLSAKEKIIGEFPKVNFRADKAYFVLLDCANWSSVSHGVNVWINGHSFAADFFPLLPFLQDFNDYKKSESSAYLEFEYIFAALARASNLSLLDLRQWYVVQIPKEIIDQAANDTGLSIGVESLAVEPFTKYGIVTTSGKKLVLPSLFRSSWEKAFYGVEVLNGFSDSRYEEKIDLTPTKTGEKITNLRLIETSGSSPELLKIFELVSNSEDKACILKDIPEYDKNSTWLVHWTGEVKYEPESNTDRDLLLTATVYSKNDAGSEFAYQTPWVPNKVILKNGDNKVGFSFPLKPASLPGKIDRIEVDAKLSGLKWTRTALSLVKNASFPDKSNYRVF